MLIGNKWCILLLILRCNNFSIKYYLVSSRYFSCFGVWFMWSKGVWVMEMKYIEINVMLDRVDRYWII